MKKGVDRSNLNLYSVFKMNMEVNSKKGENKMKEFKVTIKGNHPGPLVYNVNYKTERGAKGFAKRIANEAFYGEEVKITIEEIKTT